MTKNLKNAIRLHRECETKIRESKRLMKRLDAALEKLNPDEISIYMVEVFSDIIFDVEEMLESGAIGFAKKRNEDDTRLIDR